MYKLIEPNTFVFVLNTNFHFIVIVYMISFLFLITSILMYDVTNAM